MKMYTLTSSQQLPVSREEAWNFISNPTQLENITSDNMSFHVLDALPQAMYEGMIIRYQIQPLLKIRMHWITEITHMEKGIMFVDEQRFGPFRFWHHEHRLIENENGTEIRDIVHYVMPFSFIGRAAHKIRIRSMLENIFSFRKQQIEAYFK